MPQNSERKIYILDTNVLVHDPEAINNFDEHDIIILTPVLEELDRIKRGTDEIARNVRDVIRKFDEIISPLEKPEEGGKLPGGGRLFFPVISHEIINNMPGFSDLNGDNRILAGALHIAKINHEHEAILVTKDINLRIKGKALGLKVEDYRHDKVVSDLSNLPSGWIRIGAEEWGNICENSEPENLIEGDEWHVKWPENKKDKPVINSFVVITNSEGKEIPFICRGISNEYVTLGRITHYRNRKNEIWGITAKNVEQEMAMNLLMHADIDVVTMMGLAGSGKTLLALACGLRQTLDMGLYEKILVTRATVPMGQDIGFLPGNEKEKMTPWMGAITDNLQMLYDGEDINDLIEQSRIEITSLSFARGRTFNNTWVIVDEAQNLTPHQMKTLATRMGEDSKLIILGNNAQIDTPYLTPRTNGLSLAATSFYGWEHGGIITMQASERSRLAAKAIEAMGVGR